MDIINFIDIVWLVSTIYHYNIAQVIITPHLTILCRPIRPDKANSITLASSELAPNIFEAGSCQILLH